MSHPLLDHQLHAFGRSGHIRPFNPDQVNPASFNLTIGTTAIVETASGMQDLDLSGFTAESPLLVPPGGWILTDVGEWISIPSDHEAQVILRSSAARRGWDHALAGYVDPGYEGRLTLELVNCLRHTSLPLYPGQQLVQLRICRLGGEPVRSYRQTGRYWAAERVEGCLDATV